MASILVRLSFLSRAWYMLLMLLLLTLIARRGRGGYSPIRSINSSENSESSTMKTDIRSLVLISSILLLDSVTQFLRAEVISLTPDTFSDKVKEKDTAWFVKFCVPWCMHCKNLGSLWEDLGKEMEGEDEIEIGEVDCATSKPVCTKVDIHSYPTFKLFYDGEEVAKYQGPRNIRALKTYVLEEAEKAATKAQLGDDKDL